MSSQKLVRISVPIDEVQITSLKVNEGERIRTGSILFSYKNRNEATDMIFKSSVVGVVKDITVKNGATVSKQDVVMFIEESCDHSVVAFNMCAICGIDMKSDKEAPGHLSMVPAIPQVTVSEQEAHRLGNRDKQQLLDSRKLALIVDLDQTLVHTSVDRNIERGLPDVYGFTLAGHPYIYHCRLRPHAKEFLHTVSHLFELHVFTMATKDYACAVTKILDPKKKLFSDRIISRDECFDPHSKAPRLKSVFPCGDEMVAIIDDREDVWSACPNLVHVKPYVFFAGTSDINAPPPRLSPPPPPTVQSIKDNTHSQEPKQDHSNIALNNNNNNNNNNTSTSKSGSSQSNDSSSSSSSSSGRSSSSDTASSSDSEPSDIGDQVMEEENKGDIPTTIDDKIVESHMEVDVTSIIVPTEVQSDIQPDSSDLELSIVTATKQPRIIEDNDNFLVNLEHILTRIHNTFYREYDETNKQQQQQHQQQQHQRNIETPDLKEIIPRLRKSVFGNCNIVFSGVIPLETPIERSREWSTARAFGGNIHTDIVKGLNSGNHDIATTHVVVGRPGTSKYNRAKKMDGLKIVGPRWFWDSAEQWLKQPEENYKPDFVVKEDSKRINKTDKEGESKDVSTVVSSSKIVSSKRSKLDKNAAMLATNSQDIPSDTSDKLKQKLIYTRTFSVSSKELEIMEAEIDAELTSDDSNTSNSGQFGSYMQLQQVDSESFDNYLGLEEAKEFSGRKRKRVVDTDGVSSNSVSPNSGTTDDDEDDDDELAELLMM